MAARTVHLQPQWTVALVPGAGEWTMVMTLPHALLGARRPGADRPRLIDLAVAAGRYAFTFDMFDGTAWVLAEANPRGQMSFIDVGELVVGDRYPDEFGPADRPWRRHRLWHNGVQAELQDGRDIPVPGVRVRLFAK